MLEWSKPPPLITPPGSPGGLWCRRHARTRRESWRRSFVQKLLHALAVSYWSRLLTYFMDLFSYMRWTFFPHHWKFNGPIFRGPIFLVDLFTVAVFSVDLFSVDVFTEYRQVCLHVSTQADSWLGLPRVQGRVAWTLLLRPLYSHLVYA